MPKPTDAKKPKPRVKLRSLLPPDEGSEEAARQARLEEKLSVEEAKRIAREEAKARKAEEAARKKAERDAAKEAKKAKALEQKYAPADALPTPKQRQNRLLAIIEPKTEAMVQVMMDIAMDVKHIQDPKNYPSIHASIRMEAADRVLARAYGKPKEHMVVEDADGEGGGAKDEVMGLLNNILESVGAPKLDINAGEAQK